MDILIIILICLCLLILCVFIYARFIEPNKLVVTKYKINTNEIDPLKIAFFSDTHFGKLYGDKNIIKIRKKINEEAADIVIFGGDFFDYFTRDIETIDFDLLSNELAKIDATYKYAVFGNHDIGTGAVRFYRDFMNAGGFKVLENERQFIKSFNVQVIGYDDALLGYTNNELYDIKSDVFTIIVNHEPDVVDKFKTKQNSIMFSGHTHGGQVVLPIITKLILPKLGSKYVYGKYLNLGKNQNTSLFVSRGIGNTKFAYRLFSIPEIVSVEINGKVMN